MYGIEEDKEGRNGGKGLGGKDFSWSATLVIDMINEKGIGIPPD
jgi:hypothetical protein